MPSRMRLRRLTFTSAMRRAAANLAAFTTVLLSLVPARPLTLAVLGLESSPGQAVATQAKYRAVVRLKASSAASVVMRRGSLWMLQRARRTLLMASMEDDAT